MMIERNVVYQGHVLDILREWPSDIINCAITSPPYWQQRIYTGLEPQVWGGDADCEHEWEQFLRPKKRGSIGSGWRGGGRLTYAGGRPLRSAFCTKCDAWSGNLGEEPYIHQYVNNLADVFDEVKRVLRPDGLFWLNIGDTYYGSGTGQKGLGKQQLKKEGGDSYLWFGPDKGTLNKELPSKCMADIPHRVVIELVNRGWIHRQTIIWHKPNVLPESVKDRPSIDYEFLFMLSKSERYYYEQQFEPITDASKRRARQARSSKDRSKGWPPVGGHKYTTMTSELPNPMKFSGRPVRIRNLRNIRSVWTIPVAQYKDAHFAVFPTRLIQTPIVASCPKEVCVECETPVVTTFTAKGMPRKRDRDYDHIPGRGGNPSGKRHLSGPVLREWRKKNPMKMQESRCTCEKGFRPGIVLDPFIGTGTTALVARALGRDWVGIEMSDHYIEQTYRRLRG